MLEDEKKCGEKSINHVEILNDVYEKLYQRAITEEY